MLLGGEAKSKHRRPSGAAGPTGLNCGAVTSWPCLTRRGASTLSSWASLR